MSNCVRVRLQKELETNLTGHWGQQSSHSLVSLCRDRVRIWDILNANCLSDYEQLAPSTPLITLVKIWVILNVRLFMPAPLFQRSRAQDKSFLFCFEHENVLNPGFSSQPL